MKKEENKICKEIGTYHIFFNVKMEVKTKLMDG